jgi:hypothetical protein
LLDRPSLTDGSTEPFGPVPSCPRATAPMWYDVLAQPVDIRPDICRVPRTC